MYGRQANQDDQGLAWASVIWRYLLEICQFLLADFIQGFNQIAVSLTSILKMTGVEYSIKDLESISEESNIDEINHNSKIGGGKLGAKPQANSWTKLSKCKNTVRPNFLAKSKLLIESSSRTGF